MISEALSTKHNIISIIQSHHIAKFAGNSRVLLYLNMFFLGVILGEILEPIRSITKAIILDLRYTIQQFLDLTGSNLSNVLSR